jgi:hypothetical protein
MNAANALELAADPLDRGPAPGVARVGLQRDALGPPRLEGMPEQEQLAGGVHVRPLRPRRVPGGPDLRDRRRLVIRRLRPRGDAGRPRRRPGEDVQVHEARRAGDLAGAEVPHRERYLAAAVPRGQRQLRVGMRFRQAVRHPGVAVAAPVACRRPGEAFRMAEGQRLKAHPVSLKRELTEHLSLLTRSHGPRSVRDRGAARKIGSRRHSPSRTIASGWLLGMERDGGGT